MISFFRYSYRNNVPLDLWLYSDVEIVCVQIFWCEGMTVSKMFDFEVWLYFFLFDTYLMLNRHTQPWTCLCECEFVLEWLIDLLLKKKLSNKQLIEESIRRITSLDLGCRWPGLRVGVSLLFFLVEMIFFRWSYPSP